MEPIHLLTLAEAYGAHIGRGLFTIASRVGVHGKLFARLKEGKGCGADTFRDALQAFSDLWPADLEWPADIPRPPKSKTKGKAA